MILKVVPQKILSSSEDGSAGEGLGEECRAVRASKPRRLPEVLRAEASRNIFFSF